VGLQKRPWTGRRLCVRPRNSGPVDCPFEPDFILCRGVPTVTLRDAIRVEHGSVARFDLCGTWAVLGTPDVRYPRMLSCMITPLYTLGQLLWFGRGPAVDKQSPNFLCRNHGPILSSPHSPTDVTQRKHTVPSLFQVLLLPCGGGADPFVSPIYPSRVGTPPVKPALLSP